MANNLESVLEIARNTYKKAIYDVQMNRIFNLIAQIDGINEADALFNIADLFIEYNSAEQEWQIAYTHTTNAYSQSYYEIEDTTGADHFVERTTQIKLYGLRKKYKIIGNSNKFNIYTNSLSKIRITLCGEEEYELDAHEKLVREQLNNFDMPEYFALRVLAALSFGGWSSNKICELLSVK